MMLAGASLLLAIVCAVAWFDARFHRIVVDDHDRRYARAYAAMEIAGGVGAIAFLILAIVLAFVGSP